MNLFSNRPGTLAISAVIFSLGMAGAGLAENTSPPDALLPPPLIADETASAPTAVKAGKAKKCKPCTARKQGVKRAVDLRKALKGKKAQD